jgi:hypothetical protein
VSAYQVPDDIYRRERVAVELSEAEEELLVSGLNQWSGPANCSQELALAMGFADVDDLYRQVRRIRSELRVGEGLSRVDWARALTAAEFCFASLVFGCAWDWTIVTGLSDEESVFLLRAVQRKIVKARALSFIGTRPPRPSAT